MHSFSRLAYLAPLLRASVPKVMSYQRHTGGRQLSWAARLGGRSLQFTGCSEFIASMGRATAGTWTAIPNFVEPERIDYVPAVAPDAPLLFLSRVESIKGPDLAIAIARASGRKILIAGNHASVGPERTFWDHAIVPHLGRDGIEYVGEVGDSAKNALLGRAAALVVPIQWDEPFGLVMIEAMACGAPVLGVRRGSVGEVVDVGVTGYTASSPEGLVECVPAALALDRRKVRERGEARFGYRAMVQGYLDLYRDLIRRRSG